ncbi:13320_t:CDS:2, partial [Funneliformis geosporum]
EFSNFYPAKIKVKIPTLLNTNGEVVKGYLPLGELEFSTSEALFHALKFTQEGKITENTTLKIGDLVGNGNGLPTHGGSAKYPKGGGENRLGQILMEIREELKTNQGTNPNTSSSPKGTPANPSQTSPENNNSNPPKQTNNENNNHNQSPEPEQPEEKENYSPNNNNDN